MASENDQPVGTMKDRDSSSEERRPLTGSKESGFQEQAVTDSNERRALNLNGQLTWRLSLAAFACVIGASFQFGYQTSVLNPPQQLLQQEYEHNFADNYSSVGNSTKLSKNDVRLLWSVTVSIFGVGGMIGGFAGSYVATAIGRKKLMLYNNILMLAGTGFMIGTKYAKLYYLLIIGRVLMGVNCGLSTVVAPLYLNELSPINLRGGIGTLNQLAITTGILCTGALGLNAVLGSESLYQWLFVVPLLAGVVQLLLLPLCPESPAWYYLDRKDESSSRSALQVLRGPTANVQDEIQAYANEALERKRWPKVTMKDMFTKSWLRQPLIIACVMQLSQQTTGIIAVLNYSTSIFKSTGLSDSDAQYATLGLNGVIVVMTIISVGFMDKIGRRPLHLFGLCGMLVSMIVLTTALVLQDDHGWTKYMSVVAMVLLIMSFASGPGSIPWFITAELFDQASRPYALSLATAINWLANFSVGLVFPTMQESLGFYCFLPFMGLLIIFIAFTYFKVPETKNKSTEEIIALFGNPNAQHIQNDDNGKL